MDLSKIGMVVLLVFFAVLSLFVAGRGNHDMTYWGGIGFFVVLVLLAFYATNRLTGEHAGKGH
jgi:hypothetical protein